MPFGFHRLGKMELGRLMLTAVVVVAAIMSMNASSVDHEMSHPGYGRCSLETGAANFNLRFICNRAFYMTFVTHNTSRVLCGFRLIECGQEDEPITSRSIIVGNKEEKIYEESILTNVGNGVIRRELQIGDEKLELKDIVLSYYEDMEGHIKMSYLVCSDYTSNVGVYNRVVMSTITDLCFRDEVNLLNRHFPVGGLCSVPNQCNINQYF